MSGQSIPLWTTEWFETLDGDRLRALASSLFGRIGYTVTKIESADLDFELSQQAPMAPRVGLVCRSATEEIDIPALRKIDSAVSLNDHGFGIVVKNSTFRPEEKMFAQGKPLQLIDSEEFVKKLSQLSPDMAEELSREFPPPAPEDKSPSRSMPTPNRGSSGTPDFIKKLENVPGFGNKRLNSSKSNSPSDTSPSASTSPLLQSEPAPTAAAAPSPAPASPPPSVLSTPPSPASEPSPEENKAEPVKGLDLTTSPPANSPSGESTSAPPSALPPLAQSLPKAPAPASAPASSPASPSAVTPPASPVSEGNKPSAAAERPLIQDINKKSAPEGSPNPPSGSAPGHQPSGDSPAGAPPAKTALPADAPTPAGEASTPSPAAPVKNETEPESSPASLETGSDSKPAAKTSVELTPDASAFDKFRPKDGDTDTQAPSAPSPLQDAPPTTGLPMIEGSATPPPIPQDHSENETVVHLPKSKKKRARVAALIALPILLVPVLGGFFVVKKIFSPKTTAPVVDTSPVPVVPTFDPEEVKLHSESLAAKIIDLKLVTQELRARSAALKVAVAGTEARKAGVEIAPTGKETLLDLIEAVIRDRASGESVVQVNGTTPPPLEIGDVEIESIANYLVLEDGLLKFSMEARTPPAPNASSDSLGSGEELLLQLQSLLNEQHVSTAQHNAKKIADIAKTAKDAGLDFTAAGRRNIEKTVTAIVEGETVGNYMNTGEDAVFKVDLSDKAKRSALAYLALEQGEVTYVKDPDPAPPAPFDLVGKDLIYDLKRGVSICEKAIEHNRGQIGPIAATVKNLEIEQEGILAITGKPASVTFASGTLTVLIPRDFTFEHESDDSLLIKPKYSPNKEATWLRLRLQTPEGGSNFAGMSGANRLKALAKSLGRPIEKLGDKAYYWKNEEILEGDLLYWVTERHVGFGNSIVLVADATAKGMEELPESARLQTVLPGIIRSVSETGHVPTPVEAADAGDSIPDKSGPELLPGSAIRR